MIIQRARKRAHRQIQRKDATEDILDSDQYGRHSRGMQRRYRGEYDYFHSLLSVISSTIVRSIYVSDRCNFQGGRDSGDDSARIENESHATDRLNPA